MGSRKISIEGNDKFASALGDGTAKPGEAVGIIDATGKVVGCDVGASELFVGFLDNKYDVADDTAIPDGEPVNIIIPESGKAYRTWITDPSGAVTSGNSHVMSATAGNLVGAANTNLNTATPLMTNIKALANGDRVMEGRWL